jgi:hypothetical protein
MDGSFRRYSLEDIGFCHSLFFQLLKYAVARELDLAILHLGHVLFDCREFIKVQSGFWRHGSNKAMGGSRMDGKCDTIVQDKMLRWINPTLFPPKFF